MPEQLNESYIQIKGKAMLLEPIDRSIAYKLEVDGEITEVKELNNENGKFDRVYVFQVARAEVKDNLGKVTRTKDSRRAHIKLRSTIRYEWEHSQSEKTEEEYYQEKMSKIMKAIIEGKI